jgi:hypothetical protein
MTITLLRNINKFANMVNLILQDKRVRNFLWRDKSLAKWERYKQRLLNEYELVFMPMRTSVFNLLNFYLGCFLLIIYFHM